MTVLDERQLVGWHGVNPRSAGLPVRSRPVRSMPMPTRPPRTSGPIRPYRPAPTRPNIAPLHYRGTGATRSQAVHIHRPVSTPVTLALAGIAALITLWLGSLAQFGAGQAAAPAISPDHIGVVQVQSGETLQHLAGRVAPDAPVDQVVKRIRELNDLDSVAVNAGQTLIAPLG